MKWLPVSDLLVSRLGDANHSTLDHLVSRDHQNKIAVSITDWRSIAPFLGLEETDEEDIEVMYFTTKTCHGNFGPPKILVRGTKIPGKLVRRTIIF